MKRPGFNTGFGALLVAIFVGVWLWQSPGVYRGKLTHGEIAGYLAKIEQLTLPPEERSELLKRMRAWAEADDGKPFYMVSVVRYHEKLRTYPGMPAFSGTPREANELYEKAATPLMLKWGAFPVYVGAMHGRNVMGFGPGEDEWSRASVVRYRSRRAFLDLLTDPKYGPIEPYKVMAVDFTASPTSLVLALPNLMFVIGATFLVIFLATGWFRATRLRASRSGTA